MNSGMEIRKRVTRNTPINGSMTNLNVDRPLTIEENLSHAGLDTESKQVYLQTIQSLTCSSMFEE